MNRLFKTITKSQNQESIIPLHKTQSTEHKVLIEQLELDMFIGILPEEKTKKQLVIISLELHLKPKDNYNDKIENTVCYGGIITAIETLTASKHFNLIETLAEEITAECFQHATVKKVDISIKKPNIINSAKAVGFSMVTSKESNC